MENQLLENVSSKWTTLWWEAAEQEQQKLDLNEKQNKKKRRHKDGWIEKRSESGGVKSSNKNDQKMFEITKDLPDPLWEYWRGNTISAIITLCFNCNFTSLSNNQNARGYERAKEKKMIISLMRSGGFHRGVCAKLTMRIPISE